MKIEKITIYELLGLVKDGKAPEEIRYKNFVYGWVRKYKTYIRYDITGKALYITINNLNDYVEIIEEPKKIKKIKQLNNVAGCKELIELEDKQQINNHILKDKINELIDEINNLKEKKEEQEG